MGRTRKSGDPIERLLYGGNTSCVYVIEADGVHEVKIGVSNNPVSRCRTMQTGSRDKLILFWVGRVPEKLAYKVEKATHGILKKEGRHKAGEWFGCSGAYARDAVKRGAAKVGVNIQDDISYSMDYRQ